MGNIVIVVRGPRGFPDCCQKVNNNFKIVLLHALYVCMSLPMLTKSVNKLLFYSHVKLKGIINAPIVQIRLYITI